MKYMYDIISITSGSNLEINFYLLCLYFHCHSLLNTISGVESLPLQLQFQLQEQ